MYYFNIDHVMGITRGIRGKEPCLNCRAHVCVGSQLIAPMPLASVCELFRGAARICLQYQSAQQKN